MGRGQQEALARGPDVGSGRSAVLGSPPGPELCWPTGQGAWEQERQRCAAWPGRDGAARAPPTSGVGPRWPHRPALGDGQPVWLWAHIPVPWESPAHPTSAESPGNSVLTASSGRGQACCPPSAGGSLRGFWACSPTSGPVDTLAGHSFQTRCAGWGRCVSVCVLARVCACEHV